MPRISFKLFSFFILVLMIPACSVISDLRHKQYAYYVNEKKRKLVFLLPKGTAEENYRVGENDAREQFYLYKDGAILYVARHITWETVNKQKIDELLSTSKNRVAMFSGTDKSGLLWKEIHFEDFMIGYTNVPAGRAELFDEALNSVKIR